jgi:hypothetical protein
LNVLWRLSSFYQGADASSNFRQLVVIKSHGSPSWRDP